MTNKRAVKLIGEARDNANKKIREFTETGRLAAGMASEGYSGGYRDALEDVMLLLAYAVPQRREYWKHLMEQAG